MIMGKKGNGLEQKEATTVQSCTPKSTQTCIKVFQKTNNKIRPNPILYIEADCCEPYVA